MSEWIQVNVPRTLYLPVNNGDGFKDSGRRVEPSDKVEFCPGTNKCRINGVEHSMLRSCDNIPLTDDHTINLARPARPVALSRGGVGSASVGPMGSAVRAARGNWDHSVVEEWQGDAGTARFPVRAPTAGEDLFGKPDPHRGFRQAGETRTASTAPPSDGDVQWTGEEQGLIDEALGEFEAGLQAQYDKTDKDFE